MAPTKTTIEWVSGIVGRYCVRRTGVASKERAARVAGTHGQLGSRWGWGGGEARTDFVGERREVIRDRVLEIVMSADKEGRRQKAEWCTLMTFSSFSEPLMERIDKRCRSWTMCFGQMLIAGSPKSGNGVPKKGQTDP